MNATDTKTRTAVRCTYSDGDTITTEINATLDEARKYFLGCPKTTEDEQTGKETTVFCTAVDLVSE